MKKKISLFLIITLLLISVNTCFVFALDQELMGFSAVNAALELLDKSNEGTARSQAISEWMYQNSRAAGFMYDAASSLLTPLALYAILPSDVQSELGENPSDDEIEDAARTFILNNQTVTDNSIVNDESINTFIKDWSDYYVSQQGDYYAKAFDLHNATSSFTDGSLFLALKDFIQNDNHLFRFYGWAPAQGGYFIATCNDTNLTFVESSSSNGRITVSLYNKVSWDAYPFTPNTTFDIYFYNSTSGEFEQNTSITYIPNNWYFVCDRSSNYVVVQNAAYEPYLVSMSNTDYVQVFKTVQSLKDAQVGYSSYYYNNDVWSDFSTTSGDWTWSPTNINTVSYGDVITHIDNTKSDDDYYPTSTQINNWIENKNTENIENGGGNGSGSDDDDSSIVDILGNIGNLIGNIIKAIAKFLEGVLEGLVSALETLVEGVTSLITTIVEGLPTVFFEFIGALFDWMPEEWTALLSAGLVFMLLWGIIKTIKG